MKRKKQDISKPEPGKGPEDLGEQKESSAGGWEKMSPETPYQTRYFSVQMDKKGSAIDSDLHNIVSVSEDVAKRSAKEVYASQKKKGFYSIYRYKSVKENNNTLVIFLDSRQELESFRTNLLTSVTVSLAGLLAVFVLLLFFSRIYSADD